MTWSALATIAPFGVTALLVSLRLFAATLPVPGLGGPSIPRGSRVLLAVALSSGFTLGLEKLSIAELSVAHLAFLAAREFVVGAVMGLCFSVPLFALRSAGELVGGTMGLGFSQAVDPLTGVQDTSTGRLYGTLAALAFLAAHGPRVVLVFIGWSLHHLPPGQLSLPPLAPVVSLLGAQLFDIALRVAAPPVVAVLVAQMMVGLVGRASPALNVFAVGFGIALVVAGLSVFLSWPAVLPVLENALDENLRLGAELLSHAAP